ncbi:MAG: single-stranded DNA-binding protein [Rhodospirillaceae bacterium]|nr:single-stranded DNA-binding protein [Rhodospirillaceae bacterium]
MLNMNRATLLGHAGRDPDVRDLKNGGKAATFPLATTGKWTDREGRPAEATEWHRIVVYGAAVKAVETMLKKGDAVMVEGRIATRGFRDREGTDRTVTEIVVAGAQGTVNMLGGGRPQTADADENPEAGDDPAGEPAAPANGAAEDPGSVSGAGAPG